MEQTLLLVDDEPNVLNSLERTLEDDGYIIYTADSGKSALALLATTTVQLIISDQRMPNMTGAELLTEVKKLYPNTARIILSGFTDFNALKDAINNGAIYKFINKPWDIDVLKTVVKDAFQHAVPSENVALNVLNKDPATGLINRFLFKEQLDARIVSAQKTQQSIAIVLLFLDGFNKVDELLGEINRDKLLWFMAQRLKKFVAEEADIVSIGRGKFCLLFLNKAKGSLDKLLDTILAEINQPVNLLNVSYRLSATIGVSLFPEHGDTYYSLLKHAEYARVQSVKLGENSYQIYKETVISKDRELISELDILYALQKNEFIVFYQPIVSAKTHKILGCEALVRWKHPKYGLLYPEAFIPLCEETGLINQLGAFVLRKACEHLKKTHELNSKLFMAINISPRQLRDLAFIDLLKNTLADTNINPEFLELELVESVMMYDVAFHINTMQKIAALGIKLSIDDFGTGYSSFTYLKLLPITNLKIDKSFIDDIDKSQKSNKIIVAIINLAKKLGLNLVAEGVETNKQLALIKRTKCDLIQGFLFSKPLCAEDFHTLLAKNNSVIKLK
jgi:diguanylate cyclase (GGDEF)-like protein